jgi:mannosyltransferase
VLTSERLLTLESPAEVASPIAEPGSKRRRSIPDRVAVAGLVAAALVLRVPTIGRSYWVDEAISIGIASQPLRRLPSLLRQDGSPPLWYVLLHVWILVFGSTPVSTHSLSLLISLMVIPLAYWAGRELFGRPAALAAAGLVATNPFMAWYATENRMYTLAIAIALVALTFTVMAVRDRSPRSAAGAAVAFAALDYTHNWGLYLTAVTVGYVVVRALLARDRELLRWTLGSGAAVVALYSPWIPSFLRQAATTAAPWAVPPRVGDFFADPTTAMGGTIGVIIAPLLIGGVIWTRGQRSRGTSQAATFLVSVTLATTALGWVVSQFEPSWTVRYLAVTIPGWLLATAGTLAATRTGRRVVIAACVLLGTWSIVAAPVTTLVKTGTLTLEANPDPSNAKDNAAAIAAAASPDLRSGDLVVVTQTEQTPVVHYYLPSGLTYYDPVGRVADPSVVDWTNLVDRLARARACQTIVPAIAALPVGAHVLEVAPEFQFGASGSVWAKVVNYQWRHIEYILTNEPSLRSVVSYGEGSTSPTPYSPVIGELFVKQRGPTTCP